MQISHKEWMSLTTWAKVRIGDSTSSPDMLHIRDSSPSQEWKIFFEKFAMASPWSWVGILRLAFGVWRLPQRGVEHETTNPRTNLRNHLVRSFSRALQYCSKNIFPSRKILGLGRDHSEKDNPLRLGPFPTAKAIPYRGQKNETKIGPLVTNQKAFFCQKWVGQKSIWFFAQLWGRDKNSRVVMKNDPLMGYKLRTTWPPLI